MKAWLVLLLFVATALHGQEVELIWQEQKPIAINLELLPQFEHVKVKGAKNPIIGEVGDVEGQLVFTPLWPFQRGVNYEVLLSDGSIYSFKIPEKKGIRPRLLAFYPGSDSLPQNLLKIYLQFDQPMREGISHEMIKIFDKDGPVSAFLDLTTELWNDDQTRLTIWLDPGRIKRDLTPNIDMGPPLKAGSQYEVRISNEWRSTSGQSLKESYSKKFYVIPSDREIPEIEKWKLLVPKSEKEPLRIEFGEPLDYSLASEVITVWRKQERVKGTITLSSNESLWEFSPNEVWETGQYRIEIEARLEDLAGNNLNRPFDLDISTDPNIENNKWRELFFKFP